MLHEAYTFKAVPVQRSRIELGSEMGKKSLKVTFARDIEVAQAFIVAPPSELTLLKVYRLHRDDDETAVIWTGRVLNAEWRGSEAELNCEPVYISLKRVGLRRLYQRNCPHVVFGPTCGVNSVEFRVPGKVVQVDNHVVQVPEAAAHPDGYFSGGYATWVAAGITEKRMITVHARDQVTFAAVPPGLQAGHNIIIYPGCDRTFAACQNKFNNGANYGGFPYMPTKNPFDGKPIY